jgi:hypothetical protein
LPPDALELGATALAGIDDEGAGEEDGEAPQATG